MQGPLNLFIHLLVLDIRTSISMGGGKLFSLVPVVREKRDTNDVQNNNQQVVSVGTWNFPSGKNS